MAGSIGILNVGAGDTKLSFDKSNPAECIRAARIVKDMLRRGYALLIEVPPKRRGGKSTTQRVYDFREDTCEYIIADLDSEIAATADAAEGKNGQSGKDEKNDASVHGEPSGVPATTARGRGRPRTRAVSASGVSGVAVGRTAGG